MCFRGLGPPGSPAWPRRPRGGGKGRGAGAGLALAGSRWVGVGRRLPSARPRAGRSGRRIRGPAVATLRSCRRGDREMPGFSAPSRGRGLLSVRKGCGAEAGSAGWGLAGRGCCRPGLSIAPPKGRPQLAPVAGETSRRRSLLGASRAAAHGACVCRSPRLLSASRAQAGGGGPQRGVGTSRVTDLFEGAGWGRVGCTRTVFLYSSAVLWTSRAELFQHTLLLLRAFGAS